MKLTNKIKYYLLLVAIPIAVIFAWRIAISQTLQNHRDIKELSLASEEYKNADQILLDLQRELKKINSSAPLNEDEVDDYLLELISKNIEKYKLQLEKIPQKVSEEKSNYSIQTYSISVSGRYVSMVGFMDFLEKELQGGRIVSTSFQRSNKRKEGEKLVMEIFYQVVFNNK